ncbi:MAG: VOC family protein [Pirellulaceae bacterium]
MKPQLKISLTTIVIPDYDVAIAYFVDTLGFHLREDTRVSDEKRWVVVSPGEADSHGILLAKATTDQQRNRVGNQTGGRVAFFLTTDDFDITYNDLRARGVNFCESPRHETYGWVAVFVDMFGNRWDLIQPP